MKIDAVYILPISEEANSPALIDCEIKSENSLDLTAAFFHVLTSSKSLPISSSKLMLLTMYFSVSNLKDSSLDFWYSVPKMKS